MEDCEFKAHCGGGHTTAQHHIGVYERIIKQECGLAAYRSIEAAVELAARSAVMVASYVGTVMAMTNCDLPTAKLRVAELCAVTALHLKEGAENARPDSTAPQS